MAEPAAMHHDERGAMRTMSNETKARGPMRRLIRVMACAVIVVGALGVGDALLGVTEAEAVIGRPLTPMSYAGVARRTSRRVTRRTVAATAYASYPAGTLYTAPSGCVNTTRAGVAIANCSGAYYRPYYDGPQLVYVPVTP